MKPTFVTLELQFKPGNMGPFLEKLPEILAETRHHSGFIRIDVFRHDSDPERLVFTELWESAEAYGVYFQWRLSSGLFDQLASLLTGEPRVGIWSDHVIEVTQ